MSAVPPSDFEQALLSEQTRLHGRVLGQSLGVSLVAAAMLAVYLHGFLPAAPLLGWLGLLVLAVAARGGLHLLQRRAAAATPQDPRWRRRYRLAALLHGCAWAVGGVVLLGAPARWQAEVLVLTVVAVTALSLVNLAFDTVAALLRGIPPLLPLLVLMAAQPPGQWPRSLGVAAVALAVTAWAMRRQQRQLRASVRRQLDQTRQTAALAQAVAAFDRAGAIAGVGGWEIDVATRQLRLSPQALRVVDLPPDAALTPEQALALLDAGARPGVEAALQAALGQGQPFALDAAARTVAGRAVHLRITGEPRHVDGRLVAIDGAVQDVTRQHAAEEALRVHEVVVNATSELVSVLDAAETYRLVNDAWCQAFGLRREQVLGRHREDFMPGVVSPARIQALQTCLTERRHVVVRDTVQLPGRPTRALHTDFYPVTLGDGDARLAALVTRDVTQDEAQRAAMQAATEYLRGTLEATGEAIYATDSEHDDEPARFANAQQFALWGLPPGLQGRLTNAVVKDHMRRLLPDPDAVFARMNAIIAAGQPVDDLRLTLLDGRHLKLRFACVDIHGRKLQVWSARDITAEVAALAASEAAAAQQRALLDNFPGYIAVIDGRDRYAHVNERLAALMRRPATEVIGVPVEQVIGEARWRRLRPTLEQARRGGLASSSTQYPAPDGQGTVEIDVTQVAGPRQPDGSQVVYAFGVDVTERKRAQAALVDALAAAERANRAKSQFLSSMSHELRTPLNAVLGFGQLLAQQPLAPEQQHQVAEILRGGRHLLGLINDLLDLGRIESGDLEVVCEPVDAAAAVDEALALMEPLARERGITLRHHRSEGALPDVQADPKRLRQVLLNLLSNAIKYNHPGGLVWVDAGWRGEQLELRVHDTGPGLSAADQQRLFRPFERLEARRGHVDGTGIGLALSRYLVDAMNGQIGVTSEPGQGSTFWLRLPPGAAMPAAAAPAIDAAAPAPARRLRALYIEDNPVNLMLMEAMLEDELDLATEADPLRGLQRAQAEPPDLVLLDIQLPGIDGYEVLRRLRADPRTRDIPVVAVSANAMRSDVAAGQAAGFEAYLTKPVDLDRLLETVRTVGRRGAPPA